MVGKEQVWIAVHGPSTGASASAGVTGQQLDKGTIGDTALVHCTKRHGVTVG